MQNLQLHFSHRDPPDRPLAPGVHRLVRMANGIVDLSQEIQGVRLVAQLCIDRRGLWLQVADGIRGVHVNGRPVRSMAMLRAGDVVHADGVEFVLRTPRPPLQLPAEVADAEAPASDPRIVLRGIGGAYHGRSFTLDRPVLVGSAPDADIVVDDPAFAPRHARIERVGERVMLRVGRMRTLQKFASVHASATNHFNQERALYSRQNFKMNRAAALTEWRGLLAA